jgi:dCTP deaminase
MNIMNDSELYELVQNHPPLVEGLPLPEMQPSDQGGLGSNTSDSWFSCNSAIQPASIDLHVGAIYIPGAKENESGSVISPMEELCIKFGHTAVIISNETLNVPNNIAALGFPPSSLSFRGLLMTNPGHIDPGYIGKLRFTVINFGKEDITLRCGDKILTLLFFKLNTFAMRGYLARNPGFLDKNPSQNMVNRLYPEFLDFNARAEDAAIKAVKDSERSAKYFVWVAAAFSVVAGIFGVWHPLDAVNKEIADINKILDIGEKKSKIDKIESINTLRQQIDKIENELRELKNDKGSL